MSTYTKMSRGGLSGGGFRQTLIKPKKPALIKPVKPAWLGFMIKPRFYANPELHWDTSNVLQNKYLTGEITKKIVICDYRN